MSSGLLARIEQGANSDDLEILAGPKFISQGSYGNSYGRNEEADYISLGPIVVLEMLNALLVNKKSESEPMKIPVQGHVEYCGPS